MYPNPVDIIDSVSLEIQHNLVKNEKSRYFPSGRLDIKRIYIMNQHVRKMFKI